MQTVVAHTNRGSAQVGKNGERLVLRMCPVRGVGAWPPMAPLRLVPADSQTPERLQLDLDQAIKVRWQPDPNFLGHVSFW